MFSRLQEADVVLQSWHAVTGHVCSRGQPSALLRRQILDV